MEKKNSKVFINIIIIVALLAYIALGVAIYRDYGISSDEPTERISTLVNVKYVLNFLGSDRMAEYDVPDLETYIYRNYGTFLQMPAAIFEVTGENPGDVFYGRHLYTFFLCVAGYAAFFLLLKTLFKSNLAGILGTAMIAFYPRFFAEQFYNIKDMVFVSTFMVCMFTTVKLIKSKFSWMWILAFTISTAVSTNVRIVGVVFLLLVLGYLLLDLILGKTVPQNKYEIRCSHPLLCGAAILLLWFCLFVIMLPVTWKHPLSGVWEVFSQFSQYDNWDSTIVFMGKVLRKEELPWYYVPVWIFVSVPVWYLLLCAASAAAGLALCIKKIRNKENFLFLLVTKYKYVLWSVLLMAVPWLGIVLMHSTLYNGWRHCYFLLPPLVLFAMFGVDYLVKSSRRWYAVLGSVILIGGLIQGVWIWNNHPFEMVYFNSIGKHFGADFDRDYWHLSSLNAVKYILQKEQSDSFTIKTPGNDYYKYLLNEGESDRIVEQEEDPLYYIETYRGKVGNELEITGYEETDSFTVDHFKVATVYKRIE